MDPATPNRVARLLLRRNNSLPSQTKNLTELFNSFSITHHSSWLRKLDHLLITSDFDSVALYPASHLTFDALLNSTLKESNVIGLFDVDPKKADQVHLGLQVYPALDLIKYRPYVIFVFSMAYEPEIKDYIRTLDLPSKVIGISDLQSL